MKLSYNQIDDRIDAVAALERRACSAVRDEFAHRLELSWLFHELALEGVPAQSRDLDRALQGLDGTDWCDDQLLQRVRRFRAAIALARQHGRQGGTLSVRTLQDLHDTIALDENHGDLRVEDGATEQYKHPVLDPSEVRGALDALVTEANTEFHRAHPIELSVRVHHRLTRIWPWQHHSGFVARLAANQILLAHGYAPVAILANDRMRYYQALHYDIGRLRDLWVQSLLQQLDLRARVFRVPPASVEGLRAS